MQLLWLVRKELLVLLFLATESKEDLRSGFVRMDLVYFFGLCGLFLGVMEKEHSIFDILGGVGIGLVLLLISCLFKEGLGNGDGWIFIVTGIYLGGIYNALLCYISFLLVFLYALMRNSVTKRKVGSKKLVFPFVPFIFVAQWVLLVIKGVCKL